MPVQTKKEVSAYMTVYLALTLAVLISLCLALIEGCRYRAISLETECTMDIAMDSILAEYHRELLKQYNLFAIDCSYGTAEAGTDLTTAHFRAYMDRNLSLDDIFLEKLFYRDFLAAKVEEAELTKAAFLTDQGGEVFRRLAVDAVKDDVGMSSLQKLLEWTETISTERLEEQDIAAQKEQIDAEIREYSGGWTEDGRELRLENPTDGLEEQRRVGLLKLVTDEDTLSAARLPEGELLHSRMERGELTQGNLPLAERGDLAELEEKFLFHEYLLKYFGSFGDEKAQSVLKYQVEYVIAGKDSDLDNLKSVVNRIFAIREAANVMYLYGDTEKRGIAEALGEVLATALFLPEAADLLTTALILGWGFAESVYDVKTMLTGGGIPLWKDDASWHCGLQAALQGNWSGGATSEEGLCYDDYLRIFLLMTGRDTVTARAMDLVELDIRQTPGNANFRLDACIAELSMRALVRSRYGYSFEIERQKSYISSLENRENVQTVR